MANNVFSATGRLTKDAVVKNGRNNDYLMFTLAINGQFKEDPSMFVVCFYDNVAAEKALKKGNLISVAGTLNASKNKNQDGSQQFPTMKIYDFSLLMSSNRNNQSNNRGNYNNQGNNRNYQNNNQNNNQNNGGYNQQQNQVPQNDCPNDDGSYGNDYNDDSVPF